MNPWLESVQECVGGVTPLTDLQAAAVERMLDAQLLDSATDSLGYIGALGCGTGKTLISLIAPAVFGAKRPLLLIPAALITKTVQAISTWTDDGANVRPLNILSYEQLQHPASATVLESILPDLIIADEAHYLSDPESVRWQRVGKYLASRRKTRFVALSGSFLSSSVAPLAHLMFAALRHRSPIPTDWRLPSWRSVLDAKGEPCAQDYAVVRADVSVPDTVDRSTVRQLAGDHIWSAPGAHRSEGLSCATSLRIGYLAKQVRFATRDDWLRKIDLWLDPHGNEIVDALETDRHRRTLELGFWNYPDPKTLRPSWVEARKSWSSLVKSWRYQGKVESPGHAASLIESGSLPDLGDAYRNWCAERRLPPVSLTEWGPGGADHLRQIVVDWLDEDPHTPSLVWYMSRAVESLLSGVVPVHGAASVPPAARRAAASVMVHGTGWDGGRQYVRQLIVQPWSTAARWEQVLSRAHRKGQDRDVCVDVLVPGPYSRSIIESAQNNAKFVQDLTRTPQRLILADKVG